VNSSSVDVLANMDGPAEAANSVATPLMKRPTWEQAEGNPLPLGVKWIEEEQAFNFAVHSEHAESVTLLLYAATDLVNPVLTFRFDFLHNKSGRIWHCRIAITKTPWRIRDKTVGAGRRPPPVPPSERFSSCSSRWSQPLSTPSPAGEITYSHPA
jgi:hypothetical protein